jgi:hypothetical protein
MKRGFSVLCNKTWHTATKGTDELYSLVDDPHRYANSYTDEQEIPYMYGTLEFVTVFTKSRQWFSPRAS